MAHPRITNKQTTRRTNRESKKNSASAIIPDTMTKTLHLVPSDDADSLRVRNFKLLIINGQNQGQELVVNK